MVTVKARVGESVESLIGRFMKAVGDCGMINELKKYEHYEKPSDIRTRKRRAKERQRFIQNKIAEQSKFQRKRKYN